MQIKIIVKKKSVILLFDETVREKCVVPCLQCANETESEKVESQTRTE